MIRTSELHIIDSPQPLDPRGCWVADRRIFLDIDGRVCGPKDPRKRTQYAVPGTLIPWAEAERLGLAVAPPPPPPPVVGTPGRAGRLSGPRAPSPAAPSVAAAAELAPVTAPKKPAHRVGR
jgi:hypothetical protein